MKPVNVIRKDITLRSDPSRVLVRPFNPTTEERAVRICARVMALPEAEVKALLADVLAERHPEMRRFLRQRFEYVRQFLFTDQKLSPERELLLASYFTHEYSLEAAALFNPSIVPHPDQSDLPAGSLRFIMSLRATGEGHISSITFRTGFLDVEDNLSITEPTRYSLEPEQVPFCIGLNRFELGGGLDFRVRGLTDENEDDDEGFLLLITGRAWG
jgi:hypothetical protein